MKTNITIRVIAKGGKFLGADIGGAYVTIQNAQTGEILAQGRTSGGSGVVNLMEISINRTEFYPNTQASAFNTTLSLTEPCFIKVTATGPNGGLQSANTVTATQWIIPGKDLTGGNGLLLELPGLLVQVQSPPTHQNFGSVAEAKVDFQANVTMMCGCPIAPNTAWIPELFEVGAMIYQLDTPKGNVYLETVKMTFSGETSQFTGSWTTPNYGFFEAVVYAYQASNGNSGMGKVTFFSAAPSA